VEHRPTLVPVAQLSTGQLERLARFSKYIDIQAPFLGNGAWSLMSKGYVGAIQLDRDCSIVIEPKVPIASLAKMLQVVFDLPVDFFAGDVRIQTILDLYDQMALRAATLSLGLARQGLHQEYVAASRDLPAIRGRLEVQRMFSRPPRSTVPCRLNERTADVVYNRILLAALHAAISSRICSSRTQAVLRQAYASLAGDVTLVDARRLPSRVDYTRLTERYLPVHQLCSLLLAGSGANAAGGDTPSAPFLLDMPLLFERYVARWLTPVLAERGYEVLQQVHHRVGGPTEVKFFIDLVIREKATGRRVLVMDTKYKRLDTPVSDDLAQVAYYALLEGCSCAGLVTPEGRSVKWSGRAGGVVTFMAGFDLGGDLDAAGLQFVAAILPELQQTRAA
jgi:5-methylcytosine-specific restriction enzyme subunit McrC